MYKTIFWILGFLLINCKQAPKEETSIVEKTSDEVKVETARYPKALDGVFQAHGGLDLWKRQRYLSYEIPKNSGIEKHHIDLYSRKDLIETDTYSMGYDGKEVWLRDPDGAYKGDPVFYHNLMFYFYAMPFVLADPGIEYFETEPLTFNGKSYPGIGIRYEDEVGTSPEDEYFLYYDPDSNSMSWLGYTVTYRTGKPSDDVHFIRYDDWISVSGLRLPGSMTWYEVEDGWPSVARNTVEFQQVVLSGTQEDPSMFAMPEGAVIRKPVQPEN
ncbi:DUF6503 family protein [Muriicola marianensis]|uniref:Threonine synthase n=1 Tax=Muriicola marianensis TaxID=1324801 RepID=A0ABQ1R5Z8_9FLAO|nr:DUF6503 family protein [Muriicola marianensis]GGD57486.1 hypothetical protein GCM10011361_25040 [Muriicola marianensis]